MNIQEKLREINLVEFIWKFLKEDNSNKADHSTRFYSGEEKTASLQVWNDNTRGYSDNSWRLWAGDIVTFYKNYKNIDWKEAQAKLIKIFWLSDDDKKPFTKSPKRAELVTNFSKYQNWNINIFEKWLQNRGLRYDDLTLYSKTIKELSKSLWVVENLYIQWKGKEAIYKDSIIFPCLDENKKIVGVKIRRVDNEKLWNIKSQSIKWYSTWLLYDTIATDYVVITEWEADYCILKILWFTSVIANLWGVSSNRNKIKYLTKNTKKIISFYDCDSAGIKGSMDLMEEIKRPINIINYPKIEWKDKLDINDLFNIWYLQGDFQKILDNSSELKKQKIEEYKINHKNNSYYYEKQTKDTIINLRISNFELKVLDILEYDRIDEVERKMVIEIIKWDKKDIWIFSSRDICDVNCFKKKIKWLNPSCSFFELAPISLDEMIRYILWVDNIPYTIIIDKKGYNAKYNCWMMNEWVIYNQKFYEYNDLYTADIWKVKLKLDAKKDYKYLPKYETEFYDPNVKNEVLEHFNHMFWEINGDLVLWFLIGSLFLNNCKKELKPFPLLFVFGKKWSWKTSAVEIALKILWIENSVNTAESDSLFVDQSNSNSISSLPYWSDEYKNWKTSQNKESFYKTLFDRNWVSKGTVTNHGLWLNVMDVNSSLILSGEQTPSDDAVFSRTCLIDVNWQRKSDMFDIINKRSDYYPSVIRDILEQHNFYSLVEIYKKWLKGTKALLKKKNITKRLLDVYTPVVAWYIFFQEYILNNKITKQKEFTLWLDSLIEKIHIKEEKENEDILDSFFNKVLFLFEDSRYSWLYKEYIRYNNNTKKMNINFNFLYSMYENKNKTDNCIPKKDLKDYFEKQYWAKRSTMDKRPDGEISTWKWTTLCFKIEENKYPKILNDYFNITFL